jgi:mRNA interferase HigB
MRVITRTSLREYSEQVPAAKKHLDAWYAEANKAQWKTPTDVKARYATASILKGGRVVFNIDGSKHRLVVHINYEHGKIFVRFIGSHKAYDKIDAESI